MVSSSDILVSCLLLLSLLDFGDTSQEMEGLLSFLPKRPMMVWVECGVALETDKSAAFVTKPQFEIDNRWFGPY